MTTTPTLAEVLNRVDALEREKLWLRWCLAGLFAVTIGLGVPAGWFNKMGKSSRGDGSNLVMRDAEGRVRASLGLDARGLPGLRMFDARGLEQVVLEVPSDNSSSLRLFNRGTLSASFDTEDMGRVGLRLYDKNQEGGVMLLVEPDSSLGMTLIKGRQTVRVAIDPFGRAHVATTDVDGVESGRLGPADAGTHASPVHTAGPHAFLIGPPGRGETSQPASEGKPPVPSASHLN